MKTTTTTSSSSSSSSSCRILAYASASKSFSSSFSSRKMRSSFPKQKTTTSILAKEEDSIIINAATTRRSSSDKLEKEKGERTLNASSLTALGAITALCTVGGCAMLLNPSEAFAMPTTQLVLELAESNADALDPETAKTIAGILGPLFAVSEILFIVRIVMT